MADSYENLKGHRTNATPCASAVTGDQRLSHWNEVASRWSRAAGPASRALENHGRITGQ